MTDASVLRRLTTAALAAAAVLPPDLVRSGPNLCVFRAMTGQPCPACGMTRSWNAMAHGQVRDAAGYHLLGPISFLAATLLVAGGDERAERLLEQRSWARAAFAAFGAAWIVAWIWRLVGDDRGRRP